MANFQLDTISPSSQLWQDIMLSPAGQGQGFLCHLFFLIPPFALGHLKDSFAQDVLSFSFLQAEVRTLAGPACLGSLPHDLFSLLQNLYVLTHRSLDSYIHTRHEK
jgi:hypothetical protein